MKNITFTEKKINKKNLSPNRRGTAVCSQTLYGATGPGYQSPQTHHGGDTHSHV